MSCYTHKMAIVSWPWSPWCHFTPCIFDLSATFDCVDHIILIERLQHSSSSPGTHWRDGHGPGRSFAHAAGKSRNTWADSDGPHCRPLVSALVFTADIWRVVRVSRQPIYRIANGIYFATTKSINKKQLLILVFDSNGTYTVYVFLQ